MTMEIHALDRVHEALAPRSASAPNEARSRDFGDLLGEMMANSEARQSHAKEVSESLARGEPQDLHRVMAALNEADVSFRMVLEVRNKLVEAWQEIKRMPI
jgi:flagellar hook-basal body complex protein FliE